MIRLCLLAVLMSVLFTTGNAQLSPGDLSNAHQHLEGTENCTNCHTIGKTISNDNCTTCHGEIQSRMKENKGFHATVKGKECIECHKEHHGRNFSIIRFDKQTFNHTKAGFALEGKHAVLKCEQCHEPSKISAKDIQSFPTGRKRKTFLGVTKECTSCHNDEHKGQFAVQCAHCHNTEQWKPAANFSHEKTQFQLTGAHAKAECIQCHKKTWKNNTTMQFVEMKFSSCSSCHADPHKGKFKQECSQCHSTDSWIHIKGKQFDHLMTLFPLKGKHALLLCEQCHAKNAKAKNVSGEIGFTVTKFQKCSYCHADAHAQQFRNRKDSSDCESCHTVEGFSPSTFSDVQHSQTRFTLTGGHAATPCVKCHEDGKVKAKCTKQFVWNESLKCSSCHNDIHAGQFVNKMANGCETCHTTNSWQSVTFSHDKTSFPLRGKHAVIDCSRCHSAKNGVVRYVGVSFQCNSCHEDQHTGQFAKNNITKCERCHSENAWSMIHFDHNAQSRFALTGKHALLVCEKCHKSGIVNKKQTVVYKPLGTACIDCHPAQ